MWFKAINMENNMSFDIEKAKMKLELQRMKAEEQVALIKQGKNLPWSPETTEFYNGYYQARSQMAREMLNDLGGSSGVW